MKNLWHDPAKILNREAAQTLLLPYMEDYFLPAIKAGLNVFCEIAPAIRTMLSKRTLAGYLNDAIVYDATARFSDEQGVVINEDHGFTAFVFDERAAVRIKKVNQQHRYRNYPTDQQVNLLYQKRLEGMEAATHVILGYRLDDIWRDIRETSLSCWYANSRRWEIPVGGDMTGYLFDADGNATTTVQKPVVRPRQAAKENASG
ncbi:MAG: hypothetical protein ABIP48_31170 [Planctomycetota bacterium]